MRTYHVTTERMGTIVHATRESARQTMQTFEDEGEPCFCIDEVLMTESEFNHIGEFEGMGDAEGGNEMIKLECPRCRKTLDAPRSDYDPPAAAVLQITCPECTGSDYSHLTYLDANGSEIFNSATEVWDGNNGLERKKKGGA